MKIKYSLALLLIALTLVATGCSASAKVGTAERPADVRVAVISTHVDHR